MMRVYEKPDIKIKTVEDMADIVTLSTVSDPYDFTKDSSAKQFDGLTENFGSAK